MRTSDDRAQRLLGSAVVWDNHGCMPLRADDSFLPQLERYRQAGVNVVSLNIGFAQMSWEEHLHVLSFMRRWIALHSNAFALVGSVEDIRRCKAERKLGIVFDVEGMCPVQDCPSYVQTFYELGVRWMLIAYNRNNAAGGGCMDEDTGLTRVGRAIIDEMERVGMVLCLSHTGQRTAVEALEYCKKPVIFSHSNPYGDTPHLRNVSDRLLLACAQKGGVIGLSGIGPFLGVSSTSGETKGSGQLVDRLLTQLHYLIDLVGPAHVGLGLDYVFDRADLAENVRSNPTLHPMGVTGELSMIEPESIGAIAEGLAQGNLTDEQIRGIMGENWLRIATQAWR